MIDPAPIYALPLGLLAAASMVAGCARQPGQHDSAYFESRVGQVVELVGRKARIEWEHMVTSIPGKRLEYIDLDGGKHQIVAHFDAPPACPGDITFAGKVFEVRGPSKAAKRGEPGMASDEFWEYAVDVVRWQCD
jgi:hypothetical protein